MARTIICTTGPADGDPLVPPDYHGRRAHSPAGAQARSGQADAPPELGLDGFLQHLPSSGGAQGSGGNGEALPLSPSQKVYAEIGARFNELRETDKLQAFQYLQHALMEHMALLVPFAISAKDLLSTVAAIEEMLGGQSNSGRSPSEELRLWLNAPEPKRKGGRPKGSPNKPKASPLYVPPVEQEPDFETEAEATP